jgi:hypothetical protein
MNTKPRDIRPGLALAIVMAHGGIVAGGAARAE